DKGWPPAYTMPIVGMYDGNSESCILRTAGLFGISKLDSHAKTLWQIKNDDDRKWRYYKSLGAVGDVVGNGKLSLGILAEDGLFECIDISSGNIRWSLDLRTSPNDTSVVAGDLDGNGKDEFLLGLPDGTLVCIAEEAAHGKILWRKQFDSSVANPII